MAAPSQAGVRALKEGRYCGSWLEGARSWGQTVEQDLTWLLGGLAWSFCLRQCVCVLGGGGEGEGGEDAF